MNIPAVLDRRRTVRDVEDRIEATDIFGRWFRQVNNSNVFVIEKPTTTKQAKPKRKHVAITGFDGTVHGHRSIAQKPLAINGYDRRDTIAAVSDAPYYRYDLFGYWASEMHNHVFRGFWLAWKHRKNIVKPQRCNVSSKRQYSHAGAKRALAKAIEIGNAYSPKRMYQCDHCQQWHLTSKA